MIAPLKVSSNTNEATFLTASMQLDGATGVRLEEVPVLIGKRDLTSQGRE